MRTAALQAAENSQSWLSAEGHFRVGYSSQLQPIAINQIHNWALRVETAAGEPVRDAAIQVDGGMPAHDHGLATEPSVVHQGDGAYLLQGLRFHMLGYWEVELLISSGDLTDRVVIPLDL